MHGLPSWMPEIPYVPSSLLQYAYRGFTAMVAIFILFELAPKFLNDKGTLNSFISGVGVISLGMYAGHLVVLGHIKRLLLSFWPEVNWMLAVAIISFVSFIIAYKMIRLLEKNKLTKRIFLGKI